MLRTGVGVRHPGTGRPSIRPRNLANLAGLLRVVQERPEGVDNLLEEGLELGLEFHG